VAGRELLASGDVDGTVRIWDPEAGEQRAVLEGHKHWVEGVCAVTVAGRQLLASAGSDGMVRIWEPGTGELRASLEGDRREVRGVCAVIVAGRELLASAGRDRTVRIWDPRHRRMLADRARVPPGLFPRVGGGIASYRPHQRNSCDPAKRRRMNSVRQSLS